MTGSIAVQLTNIEKFVILNLVASN